MGIRKRNHKKRVAYTRKRGNFASRLDFFCRHRHLQQARIQRTVRGKGGSGSENSTASSALEKGNTGTREGFTRENVCAQKERLRSIMQKKRRTFIQFPLNKQW